MLSLLLSTGSGAILGSIIRFIKIWVGWKEFKANIKLQSDALQQSKPIPDYNPDDSGIEPRKENIKTNWIVWFWNRKFGYEHEKKIDDSAYNAAADARGMLSHILCATVCIIAIIWSIFPKVIIYTKDYGNEERINILWGLISWPITPGILEVSSGSIVFGLLHLLTFIITCYFVQKD